MAPLKRKESHNVGNNRPHKKQKSALAVAAIPKQEPAFPRGGGGVLTPLEQKQIQVQAKQDVLFEQSTGRKVSRPDFENEEIEQESPAATIQTKSRTKGNGKLKRKHGAPTDFAKETTIKIEGLSYKRLLAGSMVLGQVAQINRHDIALSLPNNLTGYVPLTSISDVVTRKLQSLATNEQADEGKDEKEAQLDIQSMFTIGQYLRAYVTSTQGEGSAGAKAKRHIALSISPHQANKGLSSSDLVTDSMVQASVLSVEDHGLRMDFGLGDKTIHGFVGLKELGTDIDKSKVQEGQTFLCLVTGQSPNGKTVNLSLDRAKIGNTKKGAYLTSAPTVDSFLPGTAVEFTVTDSESTGLAGKVMGLLDVTADQVHSSVVAEGTDIVKRYPVGKKAKGRVICTFPAATGKKLGVSLQDHILKWESKKLKAPSSSDQSSPTEKLPISSIIEQATVLKTEPTLGVFLDVGVNGIQGFAHISKLADGKIDSISGGEGSFKIGSTHPARAIGYNSMDGMFILSLEPKVLDQPFFRLEDVNVGQVVKGRIEKMLVGEQGISGLIVSIADGISGLVPEIHVADVRLQHPERKFKEGSSVTARILSVDTWKRQLRLTLKKSLVNSEREPWIKYEGLKPDMRSPGTLVSVLPNGAIVQFYGNVRGFLPVSEMSETFIQDPREHFRTGQVVNVRVLSVEPDVQRLTVSCKDPSSFGTVQRQALEDLQLRSVVEGTVKEKTNENLTIELKDGLKAMLPIDHLTDGTLAKSTSAAKRIRIDQTMNQLLVIGKDSAKHRIRLSSKPSLIKAAQAGQLPLRFDDVNEGDEVVGYVNSITSTGVFVHFAGNLSALALKRHLPNEAFLLPDFGMRRSQTVKAKVLSIDHSQERFLLTMNSEDGLTKANNGAGVSVDNIKLSHPVDETTISAEDFVLGKVTKAKINSVKDTQINVQLADGVQGRIDVSSMFDTWEDIKDKKYPLKKFHPKQVLPVRILGMHDSRNHRFLPITHRTKAPVFELTAKQKDLNASELDVLTIDKIEAGSSWIVFVNKVADDRLWVNLSPNVRGRIRAKDASDDMSVTNDLAKAFRVGSAIKAKVQRVDVENNRLDLTANSGSAAPSVTLDNLVEGQVLPGRVTKVTDRQIIVQLSEQVSAPIHLINMADDFSQASPWAYTKNQMIRVCIKDIDLPNKKLNLSNRPSLVLSSSLSVADPDLDSASQVNVNDVRRGFIKNVADNGIFVALSSRVTAFVRVADLSDLYIKDWKADFKVDQLVKGKILAVDTALGRVQMSLKQSHLDKDYKLPLTFNDVYVGQVVTGKVRKVADFGVFVVFDNSANVSGLCHKSKMSDGAGPDPRKLYEEDDLVKAKVLSVDKTKRRISLGLKASFFETGPNVDGEDAVMIGADVSDEDEFGDGDEEEDDKLVGLMLDEELHDEEDREVVSDIERSGGDASVHPFEGKNDNSITMPFLKSLSTNGFNWNADDVFSDHGAQSDASTSDNPKKRQKKRPTVKDDRTSELDQNAPQSSADFERKLLGQRNSARLWILYMAFHLQLGEVEEARQVAERALNTIHIREQGEKLAVWISLLNLENTYGTDEKVDEVFKRACTYNEPLEVREHLIDIYVGNQKLDKADELYQATLKKHTQFPKLWQNYARFLMNEISSPARARALLPRAMQALPPHTHIDLTRRFAKLEFDSPSGDAERGRTMFEKLISTWPKRLDLWNVLLDCEVKIGEMEKARSIFERVLEVKKGDKFEKMSLKPRKAKYFFKRWLEFEHENGSAKERERVEGLAKNYAQEWDKSKVI